MKQVTLRKAAADEIPALQALARSVIDRNYRAFLGDEAVDFFIGSGASDQYVAESIGDTVLAVVDGQVAGMCVCKEDLIDLIMVRNDLQGQGVGSALLHQVSRTLLERYPAIRLECFEKNAGANRFYERNGWHRVKSVFEEDVGDRRVYYTK